MFRQDAKSCLPEVIRKGFTKEFEAIRNRKNAHNIFWGFLKEDRDSIIHQYNWRAYEAWIGDDGDEHPVDTNSL